MEKRRPLGSPFFNVLLLPQTNAGINSLLLFWCQYGYAAGRSLAASSFATCSGVRLQPTASRFSRSCYSSRAPTITVATVGRRSSQFSAICGTLLPVSFAISSIASTTA